MTDNTDPFGGTAEEYVDPKNTQSAVSPEQEQNNDPFGGTAITAEPTLPDMSGVQKMVQDNLAQHPASQPVKEGEVRTPLSFSEALDAGWGSSVSGLLSRQKVPSKQMSGNEPWYSHYANIGAQMAGDFPAMVAGAGIGAAGAVETGPVGMGIFGFAGANALPAAMRGILMDSYANGDFQNFSEFVQRALPIAAETTKQWVVGAVTGATGAAGKAISGPLTALGAQAITMPTVNAALDGRAPTKQEIADGAIVMFGLHGATEGVKYVSKVYADTGVPPSQLVVDAKANPEVAKDVAARVVPKIYDAFKEPVNNDNIGVQEEKSSSQLSVDHSNHLAEDFSIFAKNGQYSPTLEGTRQAAKDFVIDQQAEHGNEHMVAIDPKTGNALSSVKGSAKREVSPDATLQQYLIDPSNSLEIHHSHPENTPLSPMDIITLAYPGQKSNTAHGINGDVSRAELTTEFKESLPNGTPRERADFMHSVIDQSVQDAHHAASEFLKNGKINIDQIDNVYSEGINRGLSRAGVINYDTSYKMGDLDPLVDEISNSVNEKVRENLTSRGIKTNGQEHTIVDRSSWFQGKQGGVGSIPEGGPTEGGQNERINGENPPELVEKSEGGGKPVEENNLSKEGASASINPLGHILNPAGQSESSAEMATAIRQGRGPSARETSVVNENLRKYSPILNKLDDQQRLDLINYIETRSKGGELNNPELQPIADTIRDIYAKMADKIQEIKPNVGLIEDYFTHSYKNIPAAKKFFGDFVAKQGTERNLKQRTIPTLKEAIEYGLEPKTTNPLETVINYVAGMNNLIAAHKTLEIAQEGGIADYFRRNQQPEGWVPLNGNLSEKGNKILYAPEDAARVYNNDISNRATGPLGSIADIVQKSTNFVDKLLLGMSGYHGVLTTISSAASDVDRAIFGGTPLERAKNIASAAMVVPVRNLRLGTDIENAYLGKDSLSPGLQNALDLAIKNNAINVKQQDYWKAGPAKDYVDSFKNGTLLSEFKQAGQEIKERPLVGTAKVLGNELGKVMDTLSKPLFDVYIPRMKNAALIQETHDWLRDNPDATEKEKDRAVQDIGNSVDNRFGEMMRDNLFWHQYTRQSLQLALLSYSWVTGGIRSLGGGPDAIMAVLGKKQLSSNAKYLFGMAVTYALMNGSYTYLKTGQPPDNFMDLIYPRTGGLYPSGKEERVVLPSHIGQYTQFLLHGYKELGNEANPAIKTALELVNNKDFRGMPITNENNPWYGTQMWEDYLQHTFHQIEPIGIKTFLQGQKVKSNISIGESLLGIRQAPMEVADPAAYKKMMEKVNDLAYEKKLKADVRMKKQYQNTEEEQP